MKTLEQYGGGNPHLCVPCGLVLNNDRDFVLENPMEQHSDVTIHVTSEPILDHMYESVLLRKPSVRRLTRKRR